MPDDARTWIVDSIEEGIAAVEEDAARLVHVPLWLLPEGTRESDVLTVRREADGGSGVRLRIAVDRVATETALQRSREQVERLASRDPGGDLRI